MATWSAEFRLALASKLSRWALLVLALATCAALWLGAARMSGQLAQIERAQALEAADLEHRANQVEKSDAGTVAYGTFSVVADPPGPWAFLATGMRDSAAFVQRIRLLGLYSQIFDGENQNPEIAVAGAFDFSFVVTFLLPLLLIALLHDLRAGESEAGRWALLVSLASSGRRLFARRIVVRSGMAVATVLVPLALAVLWLRPNAAGLGAIVLAVLLYATFWTLLASTVALSERRSSVRAAMALLVAWTLLLLIVPALVQAGVERWAPAPLGAEIALAQRKSVNDAWDLPKELTFERFFVAHPEWRATPPVTTRFHWKWYFAFHHAADLSVADLVSRFEQGLRRREKLSERLGIFLPSLAFQSLLVTVADTGVERHLAHHAAIKRFHDRQRVFFYPFFFEEKAMSRADFAQRPTFVAAERAPLVPTMAWIGLIAPAFLLGMALAWLRPTRA